MNSFGARATLRVGDRQYEIYRINVLDKQCGSTQHLPYSLRVLLENLLRTENGKSVTQDDIRFLAQWQATAAPSREIAFTPARVLMQDFTGVPAVVDLAAMRDAMKRLGGNPNAINPLQPAELVIDHSVQVDEFGTPNAFHTNALLEFERNRERYAFLRFFFSSRRRHTRYIGDWSSDVCSSDLAARQHPAQGRARVRGVADRGDAARRQRRILEAARPLGHRERRQVRRRAGLPRYRRSEERRVGKSVDHGGGRISLKKKKDIN